MDITPIRFMEVKMSNKYNQAVKKSSQLQRSVARMPTVPEGVSMTRQSHAAECDINNIMKKYQKEGIITHFNKFSEQYGDATGNDFTAAMQTISKANSMFEELPSSVRNRFENEPAKFLNFVQDPENHAELQRMGLARGVPENPAPSQLMSPTTPETVNNPSPTEEGGSTAG